MLGLVGRSRWLSTVSAVFAFAGAGGSAVAFGGRWVLSVEGAVGDFFFFLVGPVCF